jgi:lactobin A/cerein 7B family class IIb bacteriocin
MNTKKNELNLNEMEAVNGGSVLAAIGLGTACVCLGISVAKFARKIYKDVTSD